MSSDYVAQRKALVDLSVAYEGARDFTRQVLCTAFGNVALRSVPPPSECVWPPDITQAEANSRLRAVQHFLTQTEGVFKNVLRDIEAARLRLISSGFDVPRSWIIIDPLSSIRGWYLGACGVEEVARNAASEDAALQTVVEDIAKDAEVFLRCKVANADAGGGMGWQDARDEADELRLAGERFTSYQKMADAIGCAKTVLYDAITKHGTAELQEWASKQRGASRLNVSPKAAAVALKKTPQSRESEPGNAIEQPDVDAAMQFLIEQAKRKHSEVGAETESRIQSMGDAERRALAEQVYDDPDKSEQAYRYQRRARERQD